MKFEPRKITTSVGYSFAIAALCSLAIAPQAALAEEGSNVEGNSSSAASAATGKRVYNAPVASEKSETVYVFANPDGTVKNTEVSTTLKNPLGEEELADSSVLSDIENAEDDATFSGSGDGMVWNATGKDIYYTGTTSKEVPVSVKVTYFLDGKEVTYNQLAGASGKLKIRYDYSNTATIKAAVDGKDETLYVPFTFVTAVMFDNDEFKNAEVTNGKIIDDGDRTIIAGYALPGLQKSLGDLAKDLEIPEFFEVAADVKNFEMKSSLTIATAGLMEDFNADVLVTSELEDASEELTDAMNKVLDGTDSLKKGLEKLSDGAGQLASGTSELANGIGTPKDTAKDKTLLGGMNSLKKGYDEELFAPVKDSVTKVKTFIEENRTNLTVAWEALQGMDKAIDALGKSIEALGEVDKKSLSELSGRLDALQANVDAAQTDIEKAESMVEAFGKIDLSGVEQGLGTVGAKMADAGANAKSAGDSIGSAANDLTGDGGAVALATSAGNSVYEAGSKIGSAGDEISSASQAIGAVLSNMTDDERAEYGASLNDALGELKDAGSNIKDAGDDLNSAGSILQGDLKGKLSSAGDSLNTAVGNMTSAKSALEEGASSLKDVGTTLAALKENLPSKSDIAKIKSILDEADGALTDENIAIMDQCISSLNDAMGKLDVKELNGEIALMKKHYPQIVKYLESTSAQKALKELETKLDKTVKGMDQVSEGLETEQNGLKKLAEGANKLESGSKELAKGADAAANGSSELLDGLQTFNDEGISKVTDLIDHDLVSFKDRLQALTDAAKDYNNFAGITEGTAGNVKFVIETDPITIEE